MTLNKADKKRRIVLMGNVNVGKSVLFNRLCGGKTHERSIPNSNVKIGVGKIPFDDIEVYDVPGAATIFAHSEDEAASLEILLRWKIDCIVLVADAKNLRRSLMLLYQLSEYGIPMVLNLNMTDEAEQRGIAIDIAKLESEIGIPINKTVASEGEGVSNLKKLIPFAKIPKIDTEFPLIIEEAAGQLAFFLLDAGLPPRALSLLLLANDPAAWDYIEKVLPAAQSDEIRRIVDEYQHRSAKPLPIIVTEIYASYAEESAKKVQTINPPLSVPISTYIGNLSTKVLTGIPIAILVMGLFYLVVGKFAGTTLIHFTESVLFDDLITPHLRMTLKNIGLPYLEWALVGHGNDVLHDFGVVSVGIKLALGFVGPILLIFFFFFGFLEDMGYFTRLSALMDNLFQKIGLTGKGVLPFIMGLNCITIAILMTRILDREKEKLILILILMAGMPCAPLLSVMIVILGGMKWTAALAVFLILFANMFIVATAANFIIPGKRSDFIMELTPLRIPNIKSLAIRSVKRTAHFLSEAIPMFIAASFILFIFDEVGILDWIEKEMKPLLSNMIGLPQESFRIFLMTSIRREAGAGLLYEIAHSPNSPFDSVAIVVNLIVMTILMPCLNSTLVMFKELKFKAAMFILFFTIPYAIFIGWIVNFGLRHFGISF